MKDEFIPHPSSLIPHPSSFNPMFITLEGPEGAGKTTQLRGLAGFLRGRGFHVVTAREPGGTTIGDQIRHVVFGH